MTKKIYYKFLIEADFLIGHLDYSANPSLVYPIKPNNMGLYLGTISKLNLNKGLITLAINEPIEIGDTISIESETGTYTISEITYNKNDKSNSINSSLNPIVTIGRMKGNLKPGLKVYKMSSKKLDVLAESSFNNIENKKIPLKLDLEIHLNKPIQILVSSLADSNSFYYKISFNITSDVIPELALNSPISEDRIKHQFNKTGNTPFEFKEININIDDNLYIPHISDINNLRRQCLDKLQNIIYEKYCNNSIMLNTASFLGEKTLNNNSDTTISILLNKLNLIEDYTLLKNVNRIYIPLKYFFNNNYHNVLNALCNKFEVYIYLPLIMRENYKKLFNSNIEKILNTYTIKGFIVSNIGNIELLKNFKNDYNFIGNYSLNVFNNFTYNELFNLGINIISLSPELNETDYNGFMNFQNSELIVYGNIPIMNINYCPLSKNNKCPKDCNHYCMKNTNYYLLDRLGFKFEIIPDNIDCITTIYNSKTLSIMPNEIHSSLRLDFIHENVDTINSIIKSVKNNKKLEGKNFTNGNWHRDI